MTGETVIYRNEMNLVPLRKFTPIEIDLFFAMCNKLKEQDTNKLKLSFGELKNLSNYSHEQRNIQRFINDLENVYTKILELTYRYEDEKKIKRFVLFHHYEIDKEERYLEIATNPRFRYILNNMTQDFTKFELRELTRLKSSYSKNAFRLLKQFKHTGYVVFTIEDFKSRFDIPKSYRMTDINKNVLAPIVNELGKVFSDLKVNKIRAKKGRKIEKIEFTFTPEKRIKVNSKSVYPNKSKKKNEVKSIELTPEWLDNREEDKYRNRKKEFTDEERENFLEEMKKKREFED
ncbi:replication initiation protein [Staphylococcus pettenkoferi]|uniref:replication initiation protein n=3 Tax=Bacilli TaxID=91061 RepID=UPI0025523A24|nr:RepB family plasmid replication initiator protein [Staphylococcus pettenkoferi]MDK7284314.1 RepB family plasmid replication initiator protein [Staphylococcus pettenkoferi]